MACSVSGSAPRQMLRRAETTTMPPPSKPKASDFDKIGDLGEGGFAKVSKVRHRRNGELFALKEASCPSIDSKEEEDVLRRLVGSPSPFVVRCHAVFHGADGGLASVIELMDAGDLFDVFERNGLKGFPEPALAEVASRCLMGLSHLHTRRIAHLDVRPDNFLANSRGELKITDFSASRILLGKSHRTTSLMGTFRYFSPERFVPEKNVDPSIVMAADVWSLGLIVMELFLAQSAIVPEAEHPEWKDWKKAICDQRPPSLTKDTGASPELRDFVDACLRKNPVMRATVPDLLEHPFITRRDVQASSRALRDLILNNL